MVSPNFSRYLSRATCSRTSGAVSAGTVTVRKHQVPRSGMDPCSQTPTSTGLYVPAMSFRTFRFYIFGFLEFDEAFDHFDLAESIGVPNALQQGDCFLAVTFDDRHVRLSAPGVLRM